MVREPARDEGVRLQRAIPFLWLALSMAWAVVILVTDQLAWPLALWIATTLGPLTALQARSRRRQAGGQVAQEITDGGANR